ETRLTHATFTGLLTGGANPGQINDVVVEIYRVFPKDSDVGRTSGPPTFGTDRVPTRVNSPSDVAFDSRDSAANELLFQANGRGLFTTLTSVSSVDKSGAQSGGNGPATGIEVEIRVVFELPFALPPDLSFFVPQVGLRDNAPAGAAFLWLSAPKPIQ